LNLGAVAGRGVGGRITKQDVITLLDKLRTETELSDLPSGNAQAPGHSKLQTTVIDGQEYLDGVKVRREKMSKMRELIAEHMVRSVRTSPHVTTTFEMDMHRMVALREKSQKQFADKNGFKLTFTHMIAHATVTAIKKNPIVNVSVDNNDILHKEDINLGVAVAIESGLIVPVVKKSNNMSLTQVAKAINDLVTRARSKKLSPDDVQGGSFSITNPGLFGSLNSNPIINQPQVAILSVGTIIKRPVVIDDDITIRPLIQIGLTFDHRVVDGEGGAKFLADLKQIIESYDESAF
jgi:2-oxoglutarate dehydrogenase E2 component (dihydrolipoamide succinyltransferase)